MTHRLHLTDINSTSCYYLRISKTLSLLRSRCWLGSWQCLFLSLFPAVINFLSLGCLLYEAPKNLNSHREIQLLSFLWLTPPVKDCSDSAGWKTPSNKETQRTMTKMKEGQGKLYRRPRTQPLKWRSWRTVGSFPFPNWVWESGCWHSHSIHQSTAEESSYLIQDVVTPKEAFDTRVLTTSKCTALLRNLIQRTTAKLSFAQNNPSNPGIIGVLKIIIKSYIVF